ncbi:unnamed protein product, partial [Scytosiphon promiscuus]
VCADYCRELSSSYTHYATQYGRECWCQDESIHLRHGAGSCDYQCSGDDSIVCGGFDSFSLYDLEGGELPSPPTDDNYVGCFADDQNDRVLGAQSSSSEMTSEACASYCADESPGNTHYATQWGQECWCAAEVDLRHGDGTCDMACTGDAGTTCGGFDAFDLFELEPPPPSEDEHYLGCFADDKRDRVLGDKTSSGSMSLQVCEDYCTVMDKPFFALQWGEECWCGGCDLLDEGNRFDRHGATSCTGYPCTGEASRDCGAYDAFSLYYRGTCEEGPTIEPSFAPTGSPTSYPTLDPTITAMPTNTPTSAPTAAFYLAVALGGDEAHAEAVEKQEAWEETCQATPAPSTPPEPVSASADGDPHLRVFDGTGYDCHGQGEFVLTKAAATDSEVQARFQQWSQNPNSAVTVTTGIAAREGTSSLIQVTLAVSGGVEVLVDGEPYDADAGTTSVVGVAMEVTSSQVEMSFASGLDVFVSTSISGLLRVRVYAPVSLATTGLLGNNNGVLGDDFATVDGETVSFTTYSPTVEEGTNYCTTNWCTAADTSLFTYAEGEDHGTFDLCDAGYAAPVLPDVIPASITELCGDNADCILDALLAGEEVGQATLDGQAEDRAYQEEVAGKCADGGGLCASNSFSSTGAPPCTTCPDGEVSGTGATACIREELVELSLPDNIAAAMAADATGGFAGPGSLTITPAGTIQLTEEDGGSLLLSGTFLREDGAALPSSTSVFVYTENTAQPDDFVRGQEALDPSTGAFSTVVTDIPAGSSRLFLSFVVVDPVEALETAGADTAFALDVSNSACVPSLTITLEWTGETSDVDLYVVEPGGTVVYYGNRFGDVGFLDNDDTSGFGPENYIIDSGLDPDASQVLGEYQTYVVLYSGDEATETWRLTARVSGEVVWIEEGDFTSSTQSDTFAVSLTDYDATCGGLP